MDDDQETEELTFFGTDPEAEHRKRLKLRKEENKRAKEEARQQPVPPAPMTPRPKRTRIPVTDRPGTKMSRRAYPLRAMRDGEMRFIGTVDPENRVYQRGTNLRRFILYSSNEMTFGYEDEWLKIQRHVAVIEHIDIDHSDQISYRAYVIPISDGRRLGRTVETVYGKRWGIPLSAFDVVRKDGTVEVQGRR